ncbi:MAG: SpoIIE family protein phosphatase [Candidatus Sericytochromatia bacterium]|nr:SpoIIE family protein phosphatase [Candidatus Sericytochromatia bacterium]
MTPRQLTALHLSLQVVALVVTLTTSLGWVGQTFHGFRVDPGMFVSIFNQAQWEGPMAGIQPEDQVLAVDHVPLASYGEFEAEIRSRAPGDQVLLDIRRHEATRSLPLRLQTFTWTDWRDTTLPALFLWLVLVAMATVTHLRAPPGAAASTPLLVFQGALALYVLTGVEFDLGGHLGPMVYLAFQAVSWAALSLALTFPVPLLDVAAFPRVLRLLVGAGSASLGLLTIVALHRATHDLADHHLYTLVVWQGTVLLAGVATLALLLSLTLRAWRTRNLLHRRQAQITLVGALVAFLPWTVVWAVRDPALQTLAYSATLLCFAAFPASIAYAIVRARLFDIEVVLRRTLQYIVTVVILGSGYVGAMTVLSSGLGMALDLNRSTFVSSATTALLALAFAPVSRRVRGQIDKVFDRAAYRAQQILADFGARTRHAVTIEALFHALVEALEHSVRPSYVSLAIPALGSWQTGERQVARTFSLTQGQEAFGVVALGPRISELEYGTADEAFLENLFNQLALAAENVLLLDRIKAQERVTQEIEIAHQLQQSLLPARLPSPPGVDLAAHHEAALEMGGDFHDVLELPGGKLGLLVGDVSGKGLPAAMLGAVTLTLFRAVAGQHPDDPAEAVRAVNRLLRRQQSQRSRMFVAVTYMIHDPATGRLVGLNAGNPEPLHNGRPIPATGLPLGAPVDLPHRTFTLDLAPGDQVVVLSDGLPDARDPMGERAGEDRVARWLTARDRVDARDTLSYLRAAQLTHQRHMGLYDDTTLLVLHQGPTGVESPSSAHEAAPLKAGFGLFSRPRG